MSTCEKNHDILEAYIWGLGDLSQYDHVHARWCPTCRSQYGESLQVAAALKSYADGMRVSAETYLSAHPLAIPPPSSADRGKSFAWPRLRWLAVAAMIVLAFLAGYLAHRPAPPMPPGSVYLAALSAESGRYEVVAYLRRSELFLLSLLDESHACDERSLATDRELARRLVFQKQLLEPKLGTVGMPEVKALVDEVEVILLDISTAEACPGEELQLWREVLKSRATLRRLNLLQMEDRI